MAVKKAKPNFTRVCMHHWDGPCYGKTSKEEHECSLVGGHKGDHKCFYCGFLSDPTDAFFRKKWRTHKRDEDFEAHVEELVRLLRLEPMDVESLAAAVNIFSTLIQKRMA